MLNINALIQQGESEEQEFKANFSKAVILSLAAFSNTMGGWVLMIASMFKEAKLIEQYGSGIKRVVQWCLDYGLKKPLIEFGQDSFQVVVYKEPPQENEASIRRQILTLLQINPALTRTQLAEQLGRSPETIKEHLKKLQSTHKIERIGSTRYGHWQVIGQGIQ